MAIHQALHDDDDNIFDNLDDQEKTLFILLSLRGNRHPELEEMYHQDQIQVRYISQTDDVVYVVVDDDDDGGGGEDNNDNDS